MASVKNGFSVAVDHLVLGGPGVIVPADKTTLSPPKLKRNFSVKEGYGVDGAFCIYTGEGLAAFDVTFEFWNEEKEGLWDAFASAYLVSPSRSPVALSVYHPILLKPPFRIEGVQVTEIEGWSLVTPGRWQTRLSFLEYRPRPKQFIAKKAEPAIPGVATEVVKPKTAQDYRMANRMAKLQYVVGGAHSLDGFVPPYPDY